MRKLTILIAGAFPFLFLFPKNCYGQDACSVYGSIADSINGEEIPYCNVAILKKADSSLVKGTTCDEKGCFIITKISQDSVILRFSSVGYQNCYQPTILVNGQNNVGKIFLSPQVSALTGVEISAKRPLYSFEADKKVYNVSEDISIQTGSTSDALQNAPGVWVDMEGNISLRGVSGVEIWINGKPSKIKEEGLKTYLQQLPANGLERIEVMTNPSAKYGASGTGGIINIITKNKIKKNQLLSFGVNGNTQPQLTTWLSFVWSNEKWSIGSYATRQQSSYLWWKKSLGCVKNGPDTTYTFNNTYKSNATYNMNYGNVWVEYQHSIKSVFSLYVGASQSDGNNNGNSSDSRFMVAENIDYKSRSSNMGNSLGSNWHAGTTYTYKFNEKGKQFYADFSMGRWQNRYNSDFEQLFSIQSEKNKKLKLQNYNKSGWNNLCFNFENPMNDSTTFETGVTFQYNPSLQDNPVNFFNYSTQNWADANRLYNKNHGYNLGTEGFATYTTKIWGLKYKLGLRGEYKQYRFTSDALQREVNRDFCNLFPSVHLSYQTKKRHSLSISYARRVQYPGYELDPFIHYSNEEQLSGGNPLLKEAFTNSIEAGWAKYFKSGGSMNLNIYHRNTNNAISSINSVLFDSILQRTTLFSTYANSGHDAFTGGEFSISLHHAKTMNIMFTNNFYSKYIKADLGLYQINKHNFSFDHRTTIIYTLKKTYTIQLMGYYRSANITIQGSSDPVYYINATVRAELFKRKLAIYLGVQDLFNWQKEQYNTDTPTLTSSSSNKSITQYFSGGITFRFGKIELDKKTKGGVNPTGSVPM